MEKAKKKREMLSESNQGNILRRNKQLLAADRYGYTVNGRCVACASIIVPPYLTFKIEKKAAQQIFHSHYHQRGEISGKKRAL